VAGNLPRSSPASPDPPDSIRRAIGRVLGVAIVVGAVAASALVWHLQYARPRTDDAALRANVIGIAPHVSGPIVELPVADNQAVKQGELLFAVDPRPYEARLAAAKAELALVDKEVSARGRAIAAAEASVRQREAEAGFAHEHLQRVGPLLGKGFVSADRVNEARSRSSASAAALENARAETERARDLLAQEGELNARREKALADVQSAELDVGYCRVTAPFDGYVTNLNFSVGHYARQGEQVFALVDGRTWYVMAYFRETFLESIHVGDEAEVYLLSYPGRRFRGVVQGVGWAVASGDAHAVGVLPAVERSLDWVRLAQRFPVRIVLQPEDAALPYRMGSTAVVTIRGPAASAE
jgi:multidrug resistance efflux pump